MQFVTRFYLDKICTKAIQISIQMFASVEYKYTDILNVTMVVGSVGVILLSCSGSYSSSFASNSLETTLDTHYRTPTSAGFAL